jgi:D-citramalate synthase
MEAIKAGIKGLHVTVNGMGNELETHRLKVPLINDFLPEIKSCQRILTILGQ